MNINHCKLGEIATIEISSIDKKIKEGEIPVKLCNFVDVYYNWAITRPMKDKFMEATARQTEIDRFTLHKGQVALTKDSETRFDIGISTYIADDFDNVILGYHNALITPNPDFLNGKYLNALLHTEYARTYFANNASGSGQRYALSVDALNSLPIYLPPIDEQKRIGNIFSSIDRKIELNREINRNLEAQAKQLYDYWFVQFDFPDENGKPYKSSGGEMVWNEKWKREIPKGWEVKDIKSFMRIFTGKKDVSKAIPGKYKFFSCAPEPITSNEYIFDGAAVLISGNGSYTGRVNFYRGKMDLYQRTYACVLDNNDYKIPFFYYTLKYLFQPIYSGGKHGSSIPYIVLGDLADFMYAYNSEVVDDFITQIQALFNKQILNKSEIEHLTKQRDELLPLLMNGQVSFKSLVSEERYEYLKERMSELLKQKETEVNCDLSHD